VQAADVDGDGKISLEDFRGMLKFNKDREEKADAAMADR